METKKAEDGSDLILWVYDAFSEAGTAALELDKRIREGWLCDLMERGGERLPMDKNRVTIAASDFEIIMLRRKRQGGNNK